MATWTSVLVRDEVAAVADGSLKIGSVLIKYLFRIMPKELLVAAKTHQGSIQGILKGEVSLYH
jgi:hypothetical protein